MSLDYYVSTVIRIIFEVYIWLIIIRVFLSLLHSNSLGRLHLFLYEITEPVLDLCRRLIPFRTGNIDFSPVIAVILLELIEGVLIKAVAALIH